MKHLWLVTVILGLMTASGFSDDLVITSYTAGSVISWDASKTSGFYEVQWSSSPTGTWHTNWQDLIEIPAVGGSQSASVPQFYRVTHRSVIITNIVVNEVSGTATNGDWFITGTLMHTNISPGSVVVRLYAQFDDQPSGTFPDDGAGGWDGEVGGGIYYGTGLWLISLSSPLTRDVYSLVTYSYLTYSQ